MGGNLTHAEAGAIAAQWGSMMRAGDPGYIFYTFPGDGPPQWDCDDKAAALDYCDSCLAIARARAEDGANPESEEAAEDVQELESLREYIRTFRARGRYVQSYFAQGEDGAEALDVIEEHGAAAWLDVMQGATDLEEGEERDSAPWGTSDSVIHKAENPGPLGGVILITANARLGYVGICIDREGVQK